MGTLKIGCALWSLGPTPDLATLRQHMEDVAKIGCTSVQPWAINALFTPCILAADVGTKSDRKEALKMAAELGLTFSGFCAQLRGSKTFGGMDEEEGLDERIRLTKQAMDVVAEMGGPVVTTHPGVVPEDETSPEYRIMLKSLGEIAEYAAKLGMSFSLETGQERPAVLKKFIETVNSPGLKVNYDPCNLLGFGPQEGTIDGVEVLRDHIVHTHAKDRDPDSGRATCGQGKVPWDGYIKAVKEIGYDGVFAIEDETNLIYEDKLESIRKSFDFLQRF